MTTPSEQSYRLIPLTQGQFAMVDAADYEWLSQWKWHADWRKETKSFYAARKCKAGRGKWRKFWMHREILGLIQGDGKIADHINHDTLDNRRSNIRIATSSQNAMNRRLQANNTSGIKGVVFSKHARKWCAQLMVRRKNMHLGYFPLTDEGKQAAAVAVAEASRRIFGEFSCLK